MREEGLAMSASGDEPAADTVVHCAGLSAPWGTRRDFEVANVLETRRVAIRAARTGCRHFVLISSPTVYFRFVDQVGVDEATVLPRPVNEYARSKAMAETVAISSGIACTVLRPRGIYGKGDVSLLPRLVEACRRGPIPLVEGGSARTDLTHVDDAVSAIVAVVDAGPGSRSVLNVSGGKGIAIRTIIETAARAAGTDVKWKPVRRRTFLAAVAAVEAAHTAVSSTRGPALTLYMAGIMSYTQTLDIGAIARHAGWHPGVSFEEGIGRTFP